MGIRAAVAGASGYAGGELLRLLLGHPEFEIGAITAHTHAGQAVTDLHPQLATLADRTFAETVPEAFDGVDVVFLGLPHGASARVAPEVPDDVPLVDIGADFRLADPADWTSYYPTPHAGRWTYGLPELADGTAKLRRAIAASRRVANPGCYASAVILGLAPLVAADLVEASDVVAVAASGTTGAGRAVKPHLLGSEVLGRMSTYKTGGAHQHIPEIEQAVAEAAGRARDEVRLSFTPMLAPMPRGILATVTATTHPGTGLSQLREAIAAAYAGEPFVRLMPEGAWPDTGATRGANTAFVQVAHDRHANRAVVVTAIDNLGKGAAGQAVQNANIMLGLPETAGLSTEGVAP